MEIIEYEGEVPDVEIKRRVPLKQFLEQHRKRYFLKTKSYDIILRHLTALDLEELAIRLSAEIPEYERLRIEGEPYFAKFRQGTTLSAEEMAEFHKIYTELAKFAKYLSLPCFVSPPIKTIEEYDALMDSLDEQERAEIYAFLIKLTQMKPEGELDTVPLHISKEFGIKMPADLTMENMTVQQRYIMQSELEKQAEATQEALRKIQKQVEGGTR